MTRFPEDGSVGSEIRKIIETVEGREIQVDLHLLKRSAGRFMEEAVECAMAFGLCPSEIMAHVMDAIHNESKKASLYPSELSPVQNRSDIIVELADVTIQLDHLRQIRAIDPSEINDRITHVIADLWQRARTRGLKTIDGLMYKTESRR